jgi:hypothetical protein
LAEVIGACATSTSMVMRPISVSIATRTAGVADCIAIHSSIVSGPGMA